MKTIQHPHSFRRFVTLAACATVLGCAGGGSGERTFEVTAINLSDGAVWRINRPIRIEFNRPVDINSITLNSINVRRVGGAPTAGEFFLEDPRTVVFQPKCPTLDDLSDAGLQPLGVQYELNILGADKNAVITARSTDGIGLVQSDQRRFTTPLSLAPSDLYLDTRVGPPVPVVRTNVPGDNEQNATYIEVGGSNGTRHYFERLPNGTVEIDPPLDLPLNKLSAQGTQVALVIQFNQSVNPDSRNISPNRLRWQYQVDPNTWRPLVVTVVLEANCTRSGSVVRMTPQGLLPPSTMVRAVVTTEFQDIIGEQNLLTQNDFAIAPTEVAPPVLVDNYLEDFDSSAKDDSTAPFAEPHAEWGGGILRAAFSFSGQGGPNGDFDWLIPAGQTVTFNTSNTTIVGGPNFAPTANQTVIGGSVDVRNLWVQNGALLKVEGPNPFEILASGFIQIDGEINLNGTSSPGVNTLNTTNIPEPGAPGQVGGGRGGTGSPLVTASSPKGTNGFGAFNSSDGGGEGGETGWATASAESLRRGAGGGGGRLGEDVLNPTTGGGIFDQGSIGLDAEPGFDNTLGQNGAITGPPGPFGGRIGPSPFVDPATNNNFFGTMFDTTTQSLIVGELKTPWAGAGGGAGGDAARVSGNPGTFPGPWNPTGDEKGAGGAGGGGSLHILALGPVIWGPNGTIAARGGLGGGGENTIFLNRLGGGSGAGSGGHVVIQSSAQIDFSAVTGLALKVTGGQGGAGSGDFGGAIRGPNGMKQTTAATDGCPAGYPPKNALNGCFGPVDGAGGDGSPGIIQLHTPDGTVGFPGSGASVIVPNGKTLKTIMEPPPLCANGATQCYMIPTFGALSRARSIWIALGEGGFDPNGPPNKNVTFDFQGIDPNTGLMLRDAQGNVPLEPPLLGPSLLQPPPTVPYRGTDGFTLVLNGAPLVGTANEVYLNEPDLVKHFIVQLSDVANPTTIARFDVVAVSYNSGTQALTLTTDSTGPRLTDFTPSLNINAALIPTFFRVRSSGAADLLPDSASIQIKFEATEADALGFPNPALSTGMTTDLSVINNWPNNTMLRFLRFEVLFDIDAQQDGLDPNNPIPVLEYFRLPFRY